MPAVIRCSPLGPLGDLQLPCDSVHGFVRHTTQRHGMLSASSRHHEKPGGSGPPLYMTHMPHALLPLNWSLFMASETAAPVVQVRFMEPALFSL